MNYYILADLAVFGLFLMALGITIAVMERKARRYADEATQERIKAHQRKRRDYMLTHGGLPVDMKRTFKPTYTVSGYGVAYRSSENYMADPKVKVVMKKAK